MSPCVAAGTAIGGAVERGSAGLCRVILLHEPEAECIVKPSHRMDLPLPTAPMNLAAYIPVFTYGRIPCHDLKACLCVVVPKGHKRRVAYDSSIYNDASIER